jgi:hypothetical protein
MNYSFPIAFLDPPEILRANVTSIPGSGSSPLQVIADTGYKAAIAVDFTDTTGDAIGVYIGPVGSETLRCIIGNGVTSRSWAVFAAHSRISLRSMTASPITDGNLTMTMIGYSSNLGPTGGF